MSQMPFDGACVGHGLHRHVFGIQRRDQRLGMASHPQALIKQRRRRFFHYVHTSENLTDSSRSTSHENQQESRTTAAPLQSSPVMKRGPPPPKLQPASELVTKDEITSPGSMPHFLLCSTHSTS